MMFLKRRTDEQDFCTLDFSGIFFEIQLVVCFYTNMGAKSIGITISFFIKVFC